MCHYHVYLKNQVLPCATMSIIHCTSIFYYITLQYIIQICTISLKIKVNLGWEESINKYDTRKKPKVFQLLKITRKANQVTNNGKHSLKLLIALTSPSIVLIKRWVGDAPPH